jgi:hypothetical protein
MTHRVPPTKLKGFPRASKASPKTPRPGGGLRHRWIDDDGRILEWDYQHGTVEQYDKRGKHLGEFDPDTGSQLKPANRHRKIEP